MKRILFIISLISVIIISGACECRTCKKEGFEITVPNSIFLKAEKYISNRTGKEFFAENFQPDYIRSKGHTDNKYEVHFNFRMMDFSFVDNDVWVVMDSLGKVSEKFGIPNCLEYPENCEFNVNRNEAEQIAIDAGLDNGIKEIKIGFRFEEKYNKYIWHALSVISESGDPKSEMYKAKGEEIFIDPNSGEIIHQAKWQIH